MDSVIFNQEPPSGVYKGMIPCWISHSTILGVLWPVRLSQTNNSRSRGKSLGSGGGSSKPAHQHSHRVRFVSGLKSSAADGSSSRMAPSSSFSQGCKMALVQLVMPLTRTCPVMG
jgi:hypothetical protein